MVSIGILAFLCVLCALCGRSLAVPNLKPDKQRELAASVVQRLCERGFVAYWAGGCVRDWLMGRTPKDYDVATSARPEEIRDVFGHRRTLAIGAAFGVITVVGPKEAGQVEVATFRQDAQYSDGRHPDSVSFSTPEQDACRRDFTVNGMFYDPRTETVVDYVNGQRDLQARVIRAIGNPLERFTEDKLRMLRAVRFASTLRFAMDEETLAAIQRMASQVSVVSAERIAAEMRLILTAEDKAAAVEMLRRAGLLDVVLPEVSEMPAEAREETLAVLRALGDVDFATVLAALLHMLHDREVIAHVSERWKLSNKESEKAAWLVSHMHSLEAAQQMPWSRLQPVLVAEHASDLITLHEARATAGLADYADADFARQALEWPAEMLNPPSLLSGNDLIAHGVPRGKEYSTLLQAVRDAQLDDRIRTKEEALALVDQLRSS